MGHSIDLSIIMPCYNVEKTIARALDSIFMQMVDFTYEVLIIDDASTDGGMSICEKYKKMHPEITIIQHKANEGNARSFYDGLCAANGDFFCVLDGDDYYTIKDKLQRQINFFRTDIRQEFVAVAHYHILDLGNGQVNLPATFPFTEYNYVDFLTQNGGYFHTATYMYRNIFRGNVPDYFKEMLYRGDTPRTTFHLMFSNKKVKILDFVGSAYTFIHEGIWSGMNEKQQFEYQINYLSEHKKRVSTAFEKECIDKLININRAKMLLCKDQVRRYDSISIDTALARVRTLASRYAYQEKDFVLKGIYCSTYVDSLCATLGYMYLLQNENARQCESKADEIAIVLGEVRASGGGIFREILELIEIYQSVHVTLFVTNMKEIPEDGLRELEKYSNLAIVCPDIDGEGKLQYLAEHYAQVSPQKAYVYTSHNDTYAQALMQNGPCKNICIFSFDHGCVCGLSNPNYDCYIAKRPADYRLLSERFGDKVIYIPTWNNDMGEGKASYIPFKNHSKLITACAAARYYKVDGVDPYSYIDFVISLIKRTGGMHIHLGEIPEEKLVEIKHRLKEAKVSLEHFIYIPWSADIAEVLLSNCVDIFIEPFPVVSYKITLEVLSAGVPIIAFNGCQRMSTTDFIYDQALRWNNKQDFLDKLTNITAEELCEHSRRGREYFLQNHDIGRVMPFFMQENEFCIPNAKETLDGEIHEILDYYHLFGSNRRINLMATPATKPKIENNSSNEKKQECYKRRRNGWKEVLKRWDRKLRDRQEALRAAGKSYFATKFILILSPYAIYLKVFGNKSASGRKRKGNKMLYEKNDLQKDLAAIKYYLRTTNENIQDLSNATKYLLSRMEQRDAQMLPALEDNCSHRKTDMQDYQCEPDCVVRN